MGVGPKIGISGGEISMNPNPYQFTINTYYTRGKYTALIVVYHYCSSYEGKKIMVVKNFDTNSVKLDPHFADVEINRVVARFQPTGRGWAEAIAYMDMIGCEDE